MNLITRWIDVARNVCCCHFSFALSSLSLCLCLYARNESLTNVLIKSIKSRWGESNWFFSRALIRRFHLRIIFSLKYCWQAIKVVFHSMMFVKQHFWTSPMQSSTVTKEFCAKMIFSVENTMSFMWSDRFFQWIEENHFASNRLCSKFNIMIFKRHFSFVINWTNKNCDKWREESVLFSTEFLVIESDKRRN